MSRRTNQPGGLLITILNQLGATPMTTAVKCNIPVDDIKVSNHAVTRFRERSECVTNPEDEIIRQLIKDKLAGATLVEHKNPADAVKALIRHNYERATYYRRGGFVFVVSQDNTVLTIHRGEARQWRPVMLHPAY